MLPSGSLAALVALCRAFVSHCVLQCQWLSVRADIFLCCRTRWDFCNPWENATAAWHLLCLLPLCNVGLQGQGCPCEGGRRRDLGAGESWVSCLFSCSNCCSLLFLFPSLSKEHRKLLAGKWWCVMQKNTMYSFSHPLSNSLVSLPHVSIHPGHAGAIGPFQRWGQHAHPHGLLAALTSGASIAFRSQFEELLPVLSASILSA